ncbi:DoxX family protein [Paenibacillus sp. N1-5-1-14]|uniref:DoxX family protein n=1 Tax=Paenibacillus radicibacter TaxID=2972488 RepID=UPI0021593715|nr:DoxX family protein [Paenibacillus radicibacter]MCR8642097.1 DoxX family protein [Paenibacillus radicibacter]
MTRWLRTNRVAAGLLTIIRLYVGYLWFMGGVGKLFGDKAFNAAGFLKNAITNPIMDKATSELVYPNFTAFLEHFALPNVKVINILIPVGELLVGLGLIVGGLTAIATFFGLMMNFMFLFAGTVSTNPWMILFGIIILLGSANAGRYGVDYYIMPYVKKWFKLNNKVKVDA